MKRFTPGKVLRGAKREEVLRVFWRDAYSNPGWHTREDYDRWRIQFAHVVTVGIYLDHDRVNLYLAQSIQADRQADIIEIPLSLIDRAETLR